MNKRSKIRIEVLDLKMYDEGVEALVFCSKMANWTSGRVKQLRAVEAELCEKYCDRHDCIPVIKRAMDASKVTALVVVPLITTDTLVDVSELVR